MEADMDMRLVFRSILLAAILLPVTLLGQTAEMRGTLTDPSDAPLRGATVTIVNTDTGFSRTDTTDEFGSFRAPALLPGPYKVTVESKGFRTEARTLTLTVGQVADLKIPLSLAGVNETIEVKAESAMIDTSKADISGVVDRSQLLDLPVINRGFIGLAQLLPGGGPSLVGDARFGIQTDFGGSNVRSAYSVLIDGGTMDHPVYGMAVVNVNQDAVQEFRVLHNQYDAEYSRAGTAVVNVITKSGTNDWIGMFSYFGRNDALNARNTFTASKPPFNLKRLSGTFGGPIIHDKTHFFAAFEYLNQGSVTIIALPTVNPFASTYNGVYPNFTHEKTLQTKVDHTFNASHSGYIRYLWDDQHIGSNYPIDQQYDLTFHDLLGQWNWAAASGKLNALSMEFLDQNTYRFQSTAATQIVRPSFTSGASPNLPQGFPRKREALNDTFYWNVGRNTLKVGTRGAYEVLQMQANYYGAGTWNFNTDRPFDINDATTWPISVTVGSGPSTQTYKNAELGFFLQDDVRLNQHFTFNFGARYDFDTNLRNNAFAQSLINSPAFTGLSQLIKTPMGNDWNQIQPRIGFAWDLFGNGRTILRGGYGGYSARNRTWFDVNSEIISSQYTVQITDLQKLKFFPDVNAVLGGISIQNYAISKGGRALYFPGNNFNIPYSGNATLGVQKALWKDTVLQVDFIRQTQWDLQTGHDANLPAQGPLATNPRPFPQFGSVTLWEGSTTSWYSAAQAQFRTRFRWVNTQVSYTWAKTISDGNDDNSNLVSDPWHTLHNDDRGLDEEDRRHTLSWMSMINLPYGFHLSAIVTLATGPHWNIISGKDLVGDGDTTSQRPTGLVKDAGGVASQANLDIINAYRASLKLPAVTMAQLTQFDGVKQLDLRFTRTIRLGERMAAELFMEGYNVFNHANYLPPNGTLSSAAFLIRTTAGDPRQLQWGVRFRLNSAGGRHP
jgi:hypothetical protein